MSTESNKNKKQNDSLIALGIIFISVVVFSFFLPEPVERVILPDTEEIKPETTTERPYENSKNEHNILTKRSKNIKKQAKRVTSECEINNSGSVKFINSTPYPLYVSILNTREIIKHVEIKPRNTYVLHLTAYPNDQYSYTASNNSISNEITGSFILNTCASKIINLKFPDDIKTYFIKRNIWTEVVFNEDGVFKISISSGEFYYKYETSDKIYSGFTSYKQRVHKGDKIYFASSKAQGEGLNIRYTHANSGEEVAEVPQPLEKVKKPQASKLTGKVYTYQIEDPPIVEPSMVTRLAGTIGELQVSCDLTINQDKTVQCDCSPGTNFDPPIYFRGSVGKNGTLRLGHYVNGGASDYVTLKLTNGCYVGKSIGVSGLYFIHLCPN